MAQSQDWVTRMRVLHREMELTDSIGKIERSAEALRAANSPRTFHPTQINLFLPRN